MHRRQLPPIVVVLAALAVALACGGSDSPSSPSGRGTVAVQGVVLGMASGGGEVTASAAARAASSGITVTVEGAGISTTVSANGTFEIEGVPSGTFTLVFTKDGVEIGRVVITAAEGAEVKITVQIQNTALVVIEIKVDDESDDDGGTATTPSTCPISGGKVGSRIELEGDVSSGTASAFKMKVNGERASALVDVSASAASFKCNGGAKLSGTECQATVKTGAKVHVRGTLMTCATSAAEVTASEVMVQKGAGGN